MLKVIRLVAFLVILPNHMDSPPAVLQSMTFFRDEHLIDLIGPLDYDLSLSN